MHRSAPSINGGGGLIGRGDSLESAETWEQGFKCPTEESGFLLWVKGSHQECGEAQAGPWNGVD